VNDNNQSLLAKIQDRTATVGVIGLGYVGLPLALTFAENGFSVIGFDLDAGKVESLGSGDCYIRHLDGDRVRSAIASGRLAATTDFSRLDEPDAILICVPTPLTKQHEPDMTYVRRAAFQVRERLRPGQLVVLESTTYPGTTDELLLPILEGHSDRRGAGGTARSTGGRSASGTMRCGSDFFLAFSPEREDPGNPSWGTTNTPKVVGGVDEGSGDLAQALYGQVVDQTVRVSSARVAEAAKLMENIFRAVNIALVNELKLVFDRMDVDIWEVLDAAETKPFGFMRFDPGPGWGGHCIPIDPFYLSWKAREYGVTSKFIELAGEINTRMPAYVIDQLVLALNERGKPVKGSKILVLGLAYKPDIDDPRESPAFEIIDRLLGLGAEVSYHDPHIPVAPRMRSWPGLPALESVDLTVSGLEAVDAVLLVTHHRDVDYDLVLDHAPLILDTRGTLRSDDGTVHRA
jgi:UDP-N-acetyl-D-glucosamine dehydrogenase